MTYNEWRDELKSNLLSVSESERRRVLDYYAEAYADRRDAGFTEREIIEDFGAPYDAAQRILSDNSFEFFDESPRSASQSSGDRRREERELRKERREREREEKDREREARRAVNEDYGNERNNCGEACQYPSPPSRAPINSRGDYTWVFVLLCIIFAIPIFMAVMCMIGITITLCTAPFITLISGVASIGAGIGGLFTDLTNGALTIGVGLIVFGIGLILFPVCFKFVKWMWKLFRMFFSWLRRLFSGKTCACN